MRCASPSLPVAGSGAGGVGQGACRGARVPGPRGGWEAVRRAQGRRSAGRSVGDRLRGAAGAVARGAAECPRRAATPWRPLRSRVGWGGPPTASRGRCPGRRGVGGPVGRRSPATGGPAAVVAVDAAGAAGRGCRAWAAGEAWRGRSGAWWPRACAVRWAGPGVGARWLGRRSAAGWGAVWPWGRAGGGAGVRLREVPGAGAAGAAGAAPMGVAGRGGGCARAPLGVVGRESGPGVVPLELVMVWSRRVPTEAFPSPAVRGVSSRPRRWGRGLLAWWPRPPGGARAGEPVGLGRRWSRPTAGMVR